MAELRLPQTVKIGPSVLPLYWPAPGFRSNNEYDQCLADELAQYDAAFNCGDLPKLGGCELPWVTMPPQGRRFREIGSFSVANAVYDGVTVINALTFLVPVGYDGIITMIVCNISGASNGFAEGSGTISWRLAANDRYLRDVGNIQFQLGSLIQPSQDTGSGLRIYSGNIVTFGASFGVDGNGVLNPSATIVCACYGWIYPR